MKNQSFFHTRPHTCLSKQSIVSRRLGHSIRIAPTYREGALTEPYPHRRGVTQCSSPIQSAISLYIIGHLWHPIGQIAISHGLRNVKYALYASHCCKSCSCYSNPTLHDPQTRHHTCSQSYRETVSNTMDRLRCFILPPAWAGPLVVVVVVVVIVVVALLVLRIDWISKTLKVPAITHPRRNSQSNNKR